MKRAWLWIVLCAASVAAQNHPSLLPLKVGNRWVLRNQATGAVTTFEIASRGAFGCRRGVYDLHITKDDPANYWSPGKTEEVHYYLEVQRDGVIASPGAWSYDYQTGKAGLTINMRTEKRGTPPTNLILKPGARDGEVVRTHSFYLVRYGARDASCLKAAPPRVVAWKRNTWTTKFTTEDVETPAYTGRALCARYSEGTDDVENNAEQWCFALDKPLGLVQLTNLHYHYMGVTYDRPPMVLKLEKAELK
jgi:hypothetical protein